MVEADARDHRDDRPGDVCGVESAAQAGFEDRDVDFGPGEVVEGDGRHHLEPGRHARATAKRGRVEPLDGRNHLGERAEEIGLGDRPTVDRDPLLQPMNVRGEVATDAQPGFSEDGGDHRHRRALPLRAGDMNHFKGVVRAADEGEQAPHPRQREGAVATWAGRGLSFVVHPGIEPPENLRQRLAAVLAGGGRP